MRPWAPLAFALVLFLPAAGQAKKTEDFRHTFDQVWGAAIRLIRVDEGYPIKDRDETVGYFLFDYRDDGRNHPGSVELVRIEDKGAGPIRVADLFPRHVLETEHGHAGTREGGTLTGIRAPSYHVML